MADTRSSILVFAATYNEHDTIVPWLSGVERYVPEADILIVDDSSPDGTAEVVLASSVANPRITLHTRPGKLGLNTAHLYAMEYALTHGYDVLITMDADGSHQPIQIPRLIAELDRAQFCIGARTRGGTHQASRGRRILSHGANALARLLLPMGLSEYTTSFRAFSRPALQAALRYEYGYSGYAFFIECLEGLRLQGITMTQCPIDFLDRQGGVSKIPKNQIAVSAAALAQLSWSRRMGRGR